MSQRSGPGPNANRRAAGSTQEGTAALYLRVANTLEFSAELAETHAERERTQGGTGDREHDTAQRARKAAERARTFAAGLQSRSGAPRDTS